MRFRFSLVALGALASIGAVGPAQAGCCNPCATPCASPCGYGYGYGYGYGGGVGYGGFGFGGGYPYMPSCGTQYYIVNEGPVYSGPGIVTMPAPYPTCPSCAPAYPYVGPQYPVQYQGGYEPAPEPRIYHRRPIKHRVVYHRRVQAPVERIQTDDYVEPYRPTKRRPFDPRDK